ncbi:MAG: DNA-3-methyladenine glycosylase [Bacteroidales bacterium]
MKATILTKEFYIREDVLAIARELLGKVIVTHIGGQVTSGIINETEAYAGVVDRASHAYGGRYTARTSVMYRSGGVAYVYFCYGMHHMFNVVTNREGVPHAVLVRSVIPLDGKELMAGRRNLPPESPNLANGPGKLTQALGITLDHNGADLTKGIIRIEDRGIVVQRDKITSGPRIGVDYAGEDALLPYRFVWNGK